MLDEVKLALRLKTNAFDDELRNLIEAGLEDLNNAGIIAVVSDPLIIQAVCAYCKINFGENKDAERLQRSYDKLIAKLQVAKGYRRGRDDG